jgi:hypothetical protein
MGIFLCGQACRHGVADNVDALLDPSGVSLVNRQNSYLNAIRLIDGDALRNPAPVRVYKPKDLDD